MTYLEIVNRVLRKVREKPVTAVADKPYSLLIGELVNEAKREVEDAWNWNTLKSIIPISTIIGTATYNIAGVTERFQDRYVYDTSRKFYLDKVHRIFGEKLLSDNIGQSQLSYYWDKIDTGTGFWDLKIVPAPTAVITLDVAVKIPQNDLSADADILIVPSYPVILGAYAKALAERGEDDGRASGEALEAYGLALGDAIALDNVNHFGEDIWYV